MKGGEEREVHSVDFQGRNGRPKTTPEKAEPTTAAELRAKEQTNNQDHPQALQTAAPSKMTYLWLV